MKRAPMPGIQMEPMKGQINWFKWILILLLIYVVYYIYYSSKKTEYDDQ